MSSKKIYFFALLSFVIFFNFRAESLSLQTLQITSIFSDSFDYFTDGITSIRYISPAGTGRRDGSAVDHAAPFSEFSAILNEATPGTKVRLLPGRYLLSSQITITRGGEEGNPLIIEGYRGDVLIVGDFANNSTAYTFPAFRLNSGNIQFKNFSMKNVSSCFYLAADTPVRNITIDSITVNNTHTCINIDQSGNRIAQNWLIRNVVITDYYRAGIRISGPDTHSIVVDNAYLNGAASRTNHYCWKAGIQIYKAARNIILKNIISKNNIGHCLDYQQGEGIEISDQNGIPRNIVLENVYSANNGDANFDIKAINVTLINIYSVGGEKTQYGYKLWKYDNYTCRGCKSYQVGTAHIHLIRSLMHMEKSDIYCNQGSSLFDNREDLLSGDYAGVSISDSTIAIQGDCNISANRGSLTSISEDTSLINVEDIILPGEDSILP